MRVGRELENGRGKKRTTNQIDASSLVLVYVLEIRKFVVPLSLPLIDFQGRSPQQVRSPILKLQPWGVPSSWSARGARAARLYGGFLRSAQRVCICFRQMARASWQVTGRWIIHDGTLSDVTMRETPTL